jgi:hypothetical protein
MGIRTAIALTATGLIVLAGCGSAKTYGSAHAPVAVPSPTQSKAAFPGHTCIVTDKLESETVAVTPTEEKYDSAAQNVCQQLFGAPKTYASGIPGGYELRCTGTGYGLIARIYTRPNANDDCQELATVGYRVVQPS